MFTEQEKIILLNLLEGVKDRANDMYGIRAYKSNQYSLEYTPITKTDITKLEKKIKEQ